MKHIKKWLIQLFKKNKDNHKKDIEWAEQEIENIVRECLDEFEDPSDYH